MNIWEILKSRGMFQQCTDETALSRQTTPVAYIGFDPTADSLHVGHLGPLMALRQLQLAGDQAIVVLGGGTAVVGDPSGKSSQRKMLDAETLAQNEKGLRQQLKQLLPREYGLKSPIILNNAAWLSKLSLIDFLRDIGQYFSVNRMLGFESIKDRIEGNGISFLEFSYPLLQAYDFLYLYDNYKCQIQIGGSDQWTNILSGVDLIRRKHKKSAFGWTLPLLITSQGRKMGKTEKGAIWLNPQKTSPYEYHQYWISLPDEDVIKALKNLTTLPLEEIAQLEKLQGKDIRQAKSTLALEATIIAHGETEALKAEKGARTLFHFPEDSNSENPEDQSEKLLEKPIKVGVPHDIILKQKLQNGLGLLSILKDKGLAASHSQARRLVEQGGVRVNGKIIKDPARILSTEDLQNGKIMLRVGKKKHFLLEVYPPPDTDV